MYPVHGSLIYSTILKKFCKIIKVWKTMVCHFSFFSLISPNCGEQYFGYSRLWGLQNHNFSMFSFGLQTTSFSQGRYWDFYCHWQIPGNTGCIARTCAASAVGLHLVGVDTASLSSIIIFVCISRKIKLFYTAPSW